MIPSRNRDLTRRAIMTVASIVICVGGSSEAYAQFGRDAVSARVVGLAQRVASTGALQGAIETGRLAQGAGATRSYGLEPGRCYWFIAAGEGNIRNLDLLVRRRGVVITRDQGASRELVVPGERPLCPETAQRVQVRVMSAAGAGLYALGVYAGPPPPAIADMAALLERAAARHAPGMAPRAEAQTARLTEGEDLTMDLELQGGMCTRFVAVGGEGVEDVELHIYQGSTEVARDAAMSTESVASYCVTAPTPVRARLVLFRGAGDVSFRPYAGGRQHAEPEAQPEVQAIAVGGDQDDYISRRIRAQHEGVGQDRHAVTDVLRTRLQTAQDYAFPVRLEAGRCYTVVAVSAPSVRDLDLTLLDPTGIEVEADQGPANNATVHTDPCPRWTGTYSVRLRVFSGYGNVGAQVFGN